MPRGRPHLRVPIFSQRHINLAQRCALALWKGIDYETGRKMQFSDSEFLAEYTLGFEAKRNAPRSRFQINTYSLRRMIRVGKLKAMFRSTNPIDFSNGLLKLQAIIREYDSKLNQKNFKKDKFTEKIVMKLGKSFVTQTRIPTINGNYRLPFATRILMFGLPMLPLYNFSNGLASKMHFQKRPQAAIPHFYSELSKGLQRNMRRLSLLKPPSHPIGMRQARWTKIIAHKWWQRRVLDIALLLHFGVTSASPKI